MNTSSFKNKTGLSLGLACLFLLNALPLPAFALSQVRLAGKEVFAIQTSAGGISAAQRTQTAQKNLDDALVASNDKSPAAVNVVTVKGTPVVTLGGYSVVTVDAASAKMAGTTTAILAKRWAEAIKAALRDQSGVNKYIAQLTGSAAALPAVSSGTTHGDTCAGSRPPVTYQKAHVVYVPAGMTMPITLSSAISSQAAKSGDPIQAKLSQDVVLGDSTIPAGSLICGHVVEAKAGERMDKGGTLTIKFDTLKTPDGSSSRIQAHIVAGSARLSKAADGDLVKGETKEDKIKTAAIHGAIGAGAGALAGTVIGAISSYGYDTGRGFLSGAVIGAGLGVAESLLLKKGEDAVLKSGDQMQLQLDAPATLAVSSTGTM